MSQSEKAFYFQALKAAGVTFDRHYREYTTDDFKAAYVRACETGVIKPEPQEAPPPVDDAAAAFFGIEAQPEPPQGQPGHAVAPPLPDRPTIPVKHRDPNEMAGARQNSQPKDEPIRIDPDTGRAWFQEEVRKPAYAKPRGRRILRKRDAPAVTRTVQAGEYTESFEVSGDPRNLQDTEVKITLPSYQVGIYKDRRYPFRVVCYNGNEGFHREDIINYWGSAEMVPQWIKRKYVENVLCYDMRSVIQQIQSEYRQLVLEQGRR